MANARDTKKHPLAGLSSPSPAHPASYALYIAETLLTQFPDKLFKVAPTNASNALTTLLATSQARAFDQLWVKWQRRPKVAGPFIEKLPTLVAERLGVVGEAHFALQIDMLERHHVLASPARTGLRLGFRKLAQADWAQDGQYTAIAAENALHYLASRPRSLDDLTEPLSLMAEKTVALRTHPHFAYAQFNRIAERAPQLTAHILDGAKRGQAQITDPYLRQDAEKFINELQRQART